MATVQNCVNTTSEITVFSDTVSTWNDGGFKAVNLDVISKNNSGGSTNLTIKIKIDGSSITLLNTSVPTSNIEGHSWRGLTMRRKGNDVYLYLFSGSLPAGTVGIAQAAINTNSFVNNIISGLNFSTDKTVEITAQWSVAHSEIYFNPTFGAIYEI